MSEGHDPNMGKAGKAKTKAKPKRKPRTAAAGGETVKAGDAGAIKAAVDLLAKAGIDVVGGQQVKQLDAGYQRFVVDLRDRHGDWLQRYAHLVALEQRKKAGTFGPSEALEFIVRHTFGADPTKGGMFMNAKTKPYEPGNPG